ncbi:MAG: hypothetical protein KDC38_17470, partial [Planctomycetes bacterium]|nr:hypothetical protein [Planctomycetota bacterium]
ASELLATVRNVQSAQELSKLIAAYIHENRGELDAARELIQGAVAQDGASWQTWLIYLSALDRLQPDTDLRPAAEHFLGMFGHNPVAFSECAILLGDDALGRGDAAEARRWLAYAAETRKDDFELLLRLGVAHLGEGGSLVRARELLTAAQRIDAQDLDLRNALGCLEYRSGNLTAARGWFEGVVGDFSDQDRDLAEPPATLAYAERGLRQIRGCLDEEMWADDFERAGDRVLNNWTDVQTFGVRVALQSGVVSFDGRQEYEDGGLTILHRPIDMERFSRFRCRIRLSGGADDARVALRLESSDGGDGIVFFRDTDGVLAFAQNSRSKAELHRPVSPVAESDATQGQERPDDPYDMKSIVWEDDHEWHVLELRVNPDRSDQAELYFDDQRVARDIKLPGRGRTGLRVGVSGQAPLGRQLRFEIDDFQIYRARPKREGSSRL